MTNDNHTPLSSQNEDSTHKFAPELCIGSITKSFQYDSILYSDENAFDHDYYHYLGSKVSAIFYELNGALHPSIQSDIQLSLVETHKIEEIKPILCSLGSMFCIECDMQSLRKSCIIIIDDVKFQEVNTCFGRKSLPVFSLI